MFEPRVRIRGLEELRTNISAFKAHKGREFTRGLKKAGAHLLRVSQKYYVPVQTGHLKGSGFCRQYGTGWNAAVIVGYTASYAAYVHEDMTKAHGRQFNVKHAAEIAHAKAHHLKAATVEGGMFKRGEHQQAKYLEKPARILRSVLLRIVVTETKI